MGTNTKPKKGLYGEGLVDVYNNRHRLSGQNKNEMSLSEDAHATHEQ